MEAEESDLIKVLAEIKRWSVHISLLEHKNGIHALCLEGCVGVGDRLRHLQAHTGGCVI